MPITITVSPSFFSRESTVAAPNCNCWLLTPTALPCHVRIGMIFGFGLSDMGSIVPMPAAAGVIDLCRHFGLSRCASPSTVRRTRNLVSHQHRTPSGS